MDKQIDELKALCAAYKSAPQAQPVGVLDWTLLLALIPALLGIFVKDGNLVAIIMKVVEILKGLFVSSTGEAP